MLTIFNIPISLQYYYYMFYSSEICHFYLKRVEQYIDEHRVVEGLKE